VPSFDQEDTMKARVWLSAILAFAPFAFAQDPAPTSTPSDTASAEARRQGSVALKPNASSPSQSMSQAIAFERYKELAAEREARKAGAVSAADRSIEKPKAEEKAKKQ
jgi:hypothetical protein